MGCVYVLAGRGWYAGGGCGAGNQEELFQVRGAEGPGEVLVAGMGGERKPGRHFKG